MNVWLKNIITVLVAIIAVFPAESRKKGFRLEVEKTSKSDKEEEEMVRGSFMVASGCQDCNNGYTISQITFTGYEKPQQSATETFFITNGTDRTMSGVTLYIDYRMPDGRQLHKRFVRLTCNIPPGETRLADIPSWDKQKSFYFEKSAPSKKGGTPYRVTFDPVAFYLRF